MNELVLTFLRQVHVQHALSIGFRLRRNILFTQLALNHLDLLTQIIFPLIFVDLGFQLVLNFVFNLEDLGFLAQKPNHHRQTACDVQFLQNFLLRFDLDRQILRDIVRQPPRLAALRDRHLHILRNAAGVLRILRKALLRGADKCLRTPLGHTDDVIAQLLNLSKNAVVFLLRRGKLMRQRTGTALDQHPNIIAWQTQNLPHDAYGTDLIQICRRRAIGFQLTLRGQKNHLAAFHRRFQRTNRHQAPNVKMDNHMGKGGQAAQRQYRQPLELHPVCFNHSSLLTRGKIIR